MQNDLKFDINQMCSEKERPPISYKIREYFIYFITENVFSQKGVATGKWKYVLAMHFVGEGARYASKDIVMPKSPRTISEEGIKLYDIVIPLKVISESSDPLLKTIELMYDAVSVFVTTTFKKIRSDFMSDLWGKIDLEYLQSLPYPALFSEQKYLHDEQLYRVLADGTVQAITVEEQAKAIGYSGKL